MQIIIPWAQSDPVNYANSVGTKPITVLLFAMSEDWQHPKTSDPKVTVYSVAYRTEWAVL